MATLPLIQRFEANCVAYDRKRQDERFPRWRAPVCDLATHTGASRNSGIHDAGLVACDDSVRYFSLVHGPLFSKEKPSGIFREVKEPDNYALEYLDRAGNWVMDMELGCYLFKGEPGAEELSEGESDAIIKAFLERLKSNVKRG